MGRPDYEDSSADAQGADDDEPVTTIGTLYGTGDDTLGHLSHGDELDSETLLGIFTEGKDGPA
ncbi:hypothetical protein HQQ80_18990 [Microbacteriaceae bacterium VKM Ac-2855]|nr:hypothetical protein [Microbacteriaceae bacterium VKM Ac-2855]